MEILACGEEVGVSVVASRDLREVYSFGHLEYGRETLAKEYLRDVDEGLNPHIPENYFKNDDIHELPCMRWRCFSTIGLIMLFIKKRHLTGQMQQMTRPCLLIYKRCYDLFISV